MARKIIAIAAGGTGGHIFPALAVAHFFTQRGWHVCWYGNQDGMEAGIVAKYPDIEFFHVGFKGVRGKGKASLLLAPFKWLSASLRIAKRLLRTKPHVVLGMGGYVALPVGTAAWLTRLPLVVHEQNAVAGMTNRFLATMAKNVLTAYPQLFKANTLPADKSYLARLPNQDNALRETDFEEKYLQCGNPIRSIFQQADSIALRYGQRNTTGNQALKILVVGGSLGASFFNELLPKVCQRLNAATAENATSFEVIHQTGEKGWEQACLAYDELNIPYATLDDTEEALVEKLAGNLHITLVPFIDKMIDAYRWADVVICRAGAMTLAELSAVGVASLLVPFPHAVDDHQTKNAEYLVAKGGALLKQQADLDVDWLVQFLQNSRREDLQKMAEQARQAAWLQATETVASVCAHWAHTMMKPQPLSK